MAFLFKAKTPAPAPEPSSESEGYFQNASGLYLYTKKWLVEDETLKKGTVVLCHGFAEHCKRYQHVAAFFNEHQYDVFALDHQGHGMSQGVRAHVERFSDYVDDLLVYANTVKAIPRNKDLPFFLLGHSMGGLIAVLASQRSQDTDLFTGTVLSGPAIIPDPDTATPFMKFLARTVSFIAPKLAVTGLDPKWVCRDPEVVRKYVEDSLNYHGNMRARWAYGILTSMEGLEFDKMTFPFVVHQGTADRLALPAGARLLAEKAASADKSLVEYDGWYHEILNEKEWRQVADSMLEWMSARLQL